MNRGTPVAREMRISAWPPAAFRKRSRASSSMERVAFRSPSRRPRRHRACKKEDERHRPTDATSVCACRNLPFAKRRTIPSRRSNAPESTARKSVRRRKQFLFFEREIIRADAGRAASKRSPVTRRATGTPGNRVARSSRSRHGFRIAKKRRRLRPPLRPGTRARVPSHCAQRRRWPSALRQPSRLPVTGDAATQLTKAPWLPAPALQARSFSMNGAAFRQELVGNARMGLSSPSPEPPSA